jgi:hypothetical protein
VVEDRDVLEEKRPTSSKGAARKYFTHKKYESQHMKLSRLNLQRELAALSYLPICIKIWIESDSSLASC